MSLKQEPFPTLNKYVTQSNGAQQKLIDETKKEEEGEQNLMNSLVVCTSQKSTGLQQRRISSVIQCIMRCNSTNLNTVYQHNHITAAVMRNISA